jgi:methylglyoxal reductase
MSKYINLFLCLGALLKGMEHIMNHKKIGNSHIEASVIGLGTWAIGGGSWWGDSDQEKSIQTIQKAIESGITLIDTAPGYGFGKSEQVVGMAIKGHRKDVILSTKCGLWWLDDKGSPFFDLDGYSVKRSLSPDTIKREIEISLNRLGTDYIDVYFTHWQSIPPCETPIEDTMKCLMQLKAEGVIKAIGASNVSLENINEYLEYGELDVIQEKYSMLDRKIENTLLPNCITHKISVMAYSPLEQGLLTGKIGMDYVVDEKEARNTIPWMKPEKRIKVLEMLGKWSTLASKYNCTLAHLVIAWTLAQNGISHVLCGARKPEHILETAGAANIQLSAQDLQSMRNDILILEKSK